MDHNPCATCVVRPMCEVGCDDLWKYHKSIKLKYGKYSKWAQRSINCCITVSVIWAGLLIFGYVEPVEGTRMYTIGSMTFSVWWHTLGYMIPMTIFLITMGISKRCRKQIELLRGHPRLGVFIEKKRLAEFTEELIRSKSERGDMIP